MELSYALLCFPQRLAVRPGAESAVLSRCNCNVIDLGTLAIIRGSIACDVTVVFYLVGEGSFRIALSKQTFRSRRRDWSCQRTDGRKGAKSSESCKNNV